MKKFFYNIKNISEITELKKRLINTIKCIIIFRIGSYIVLPGIDTSKLSGKTEGIFKLLDTFLGGAFSNISIFGLGIMPYISASIAMQIITIMIPYFQKIKQEGESGKNKINNITKLATIFIGIIQSIGYLSSFIPNEIIIIDKGIFTTLSTIILISGTMFCI
jgi:preprotein translocase subunit SecY